MKFFRPSINAAIIIIISLIAINVGANIFSKRFVIVNGKMQSRVSRDYHYDQTLNRMMSLEFIPSPIPPPKYTFTITSPNNGYKIDDMKLGHFTMALYDSTGNIIERLTNDRTKVYFGELPSNKVIRLDFKTSKTSSVHEASKALIFYKNKPIDSSIISSHKDFKTEVAPAITGSLWVKNRSSKWICKITPKFTIMRNGATGIIHQSSSYGIIVPPKDSAIITNVSISHPEIADDYAFDSIHVQSIELQILESIVDESMRPHSRYYEYR